MADPRAGHPRITVIVPCYSDGEYIEETIASIREEEPVEIVIVDDASPDDATHDVLARLEAAGTHVVWHSHNGGVGRARNSGLAATGARYVFPLDSDDVAMPGALGRLADLLDADEAALVAYGDYEEFGEVELVRAVPTRLDPYRLAYTNEFPPTAMFRRSVLEEIGGWEEFRHEGHCYYEDWHLWMDIAQRGGRGLHAGPGFVTYRQRVHGARLLEAAKRKHVPIYSRLRATHGPLFERIGEHRRNSDLSPARKALYPIVYGRRPRFAFEAKVKDALDRAGVWTLRR